MEKKSAGRAFRLPPGLFYETSFLKDADKDAIVSWLKTLHPLWEKRYSEEGEETRRLLRPVYWLGNWQFASLNYYHPPKGILFRCLKAEPFPPLLAKIVKRIERLTHEKISRNDIPKGWHLNTCLINFYGNVIENGKRVDLARVGEHKDFEPGPVASFSLGERAFFQFVDSQKKFERTRVVFQQWLEDNSLQIFAGKKWKEIFFHRVQRVDKKLKQVFPFEIEGFETRRVNFTFRFVPPAHIYSWAQFPRTTQRQIFPYIQELARYSPYFSSLSAPPAEFKKVET